MRYLFNEWDAVKEKIKNKYLFIFLDFDGTLVPIVRTPDKAVLAKRVKGLLKRLAADPMVKIALISGREVKDIKDRVGLKDIIYSGNHGLEIEGPKIHFRPIVPSGYRMTLKRIKKQLEQKVSPIDGAFVEDKGLSLSLHYRLVHKGQRPLMKTIFHEAVILLLVRNKIKIRPGKMVLEVRPPIEWDKGKVVLWLLARQIFALKKESVLPVYIGDDLTDEDAFRALKSKGLTIFVGRPKDSCAGYYLRDQDEVAEFLGRVQEIYHG